MKPIKEIAYDVPQFLKDRAKGLSVEEQAKSYSLTRTHMDKGDSHYYEFRPYGEPITNCILESSFIAALLVCEGVLVGITLERHCSGENMFFDKSPAYFNYEGACRTGSDYYDFVSYGSEYKWTYEG